MRTRLPSVLIVFLLALIVAQLISKPAPEPPLRSPIGVWGGAASERDAYRVIITERDGRIISIWLSTFTDAAEYTGIWERGKNGEWKETYGMPGRACGPWVWKWDGKQWQGSLGWILREGKADF